MKLDNLIHWRLEGTPDVFTEERDGQEWQVIHSGGAIHDAGFLQMVDFDKPIKVVTLSACVSLFSPGGGLALRLGIDPYSGTDVQSLNVIWGSWYAPVNEWVASQPGWIQHTLGGLLTDRMTVFLESFCRYPVRANTSRWRDVQFEVEYADQEPEPDPEPEPPTPPPDLPDDDPRKWALERMMEIQKEIVVLVEKSVVLLEEVGELAVQLGLTEEERARALVWVTEYNHNKGFEV